jgi:hypothetical protein
MQLLEQKLIVNRAKNNGVVSPMLSTLCCPDQPGNVAVVKKMPVKFEKKPITQKQGDFSSWNMPVQENGVIKCRDHDFL